MGIMVTDIWGYVTLEWFVNVSDNFIKNISFPISLMIFIFAI